MKPSLKYEAPLLGNEDKFNDPFFKRFQLRHAPKPLQLDAQIAKNYSFPTFYHDVTCAIGIFLCDYAQAAALMPDPRMKPVSMPGGRAVVTISCYEYKHVMNVPPYNEIAMTIPVLFDAPVSMPLLPLLWGGYPGFGYYVFHMPVTSQENNLRGNKIWGVPKVLEEIDIREEGGDCVTDAFDDKGSRYFRLRVPMEGKPTEFDVSAWLYSMLDGKPVRGRTNFKAQFNVTKHMGLLFGKGDLERPYFEIGQGSRADVLRKLNIDPRPFQFRFAKHMNASFDLPDAGWKV